MPVDFDGSLFIKEVVLKDRLQCLKRGVQINVVENIRTFKDLLEKSEKYLNYADIPRGTEDCAAEIIKLHSDLSRQIHL
jgi:hypothetical protein